MKVVHRVEASASSVAPRCHGVARRVALPPLRDSCAHLQNRQKWTGEARTHAKTSQPNTDRGSLWGAVVVLDELAAHEYLGISHDETVGIAAQRKEDR